MKLGISVLIIAAVVWIFWMTAVFVSRTKKPKEEKPKDKKEKENQSI